MVTLMLFFFLAYALGMLVKQLGLPPLIGYLATGFIALAGARYYPLPGEALLAINELAHIGVLLLLFAVGLKLNIKQLARPEIVGPGVIHFVLSIALYTPFLWFFIGEGGAITTALILAVALSFSSTVLAAKTLESKSELKSFHGRIVIGILIVQDLLAMTVLSLASGQPPSWWALSVITLPLLRPLLFKLLDASGHDDLLLICGILLAVGLGGYGFHLVGLSGELGALMIGALLARHTKATELADRLWSLKELFLVAFFLSIGLKGLPDLDDAIFAITMVAILPLQAIIFYAAMVLFKLGSRSAFLGSVSLMNYSEFGLIVAAVVLPEWTVPLALAVALSFLVSAPLNRYAHPLFDRIEGRLSRYQRKLRHPDEEPCDLGEANILIMGLGRVGRSAYQAIVRQGNTRVVALDSDNDKVIRYAREGFNCFYADAEHGNFWSQLALNRINAVILAMNCPEAAQIAAKKLREAGYQGYIVAHSMFKDDVDKILNAGADNAYLTMCEAGESLAHHVFEAHTIALETHGLAQPDDDKTHNVRDKAEG